MKRILSIVLSTVLLLSMLPSVAVLAEVETAPVKMVGDLDLDSEITDWDGVLLARYLAGWTVSVIDDSVMDIDSDGEITDWDGVMIDRHLAGWSVTTSVGKRLTFTITYENTKNAVNPNPTFYESGSDSIALSSISTDHYTFDGWYLNGQMVTYIQENSDGDLALTAKWTPKDYSILYKNTKGAINPNPANYNIESDAIMLQNLYCEGYRFDGWYDGESTATAIPSGSYGNRTLTAKWTASDYTITYENVNGAVNVNPGGFTADSDTITLVPLQKEGYTFDGWYNGRTKVTSIPSGTVGDLTLTAKWTACDYTITYENVNGAVNTNPGGFTIDSDTIALAPLQREGYSFDGWYNGSTKVTSIPSGTIGDLTLTAKWSPITYTATFTADGNIVAIRYFIVEDALIANIPAVPSKAGYSGIWSGYSIAAKNITIPAIYSLNEYSISYTNTKGADNSNPRSYTITTDTFRLAELQCEGYDFIGWYKGSAKVTSIEKGTTGNISLSAKWSATDYVITYSDTKGATNPNPVEYNIETGTIYLKNITAAHYTFNGWYLNGKKVTSIPAGNAGDIELIAQWTPISYSITYQDTQNAVNSNPSTYTIEDTILLQNISAEGYAFEGWYLGDEKITSINIGSYGSKTLTARWSLLTYSITYVNTKDAIHSNIGTYTINTETFPLHEISAEGYTFAGWTLNGSAITEIQTGTSGDLVITANWTPLIYNISYCLQYPVTDITNPNPTTYNTDSQINLQDAIFDKYHTFEGWYTDSAYTNRITTIKPGTSGNLTLYAKWTFTGKYISTASEFASIAYNPAGAYELTRSITITATICDADNPFSGYLYGNDCSINDKQPFGTVKGTVSHVKSDSTLANANSGRIEYCFGGNGLVVTNSGTIYRSGSTAGCVVTTTGSYAGGLVATNSGTISECYSSGSVGGNKTAGGLVGYNTGTIVNSYSSGNVSASGSIVTYAGGLVGESSGGTIQKCYASGKVYASGKNQTSGYTTIGDAYAAGLVCRIYDTNVSYCFYAGSKVYANASGTTAAAGISCTAYMKNSNYYPDNLNLPAYDTGYQSGTTNYGKATSVANFKTPVFIEGTLGWDPSVWRLTNGCLPGLRRGY